MRLLLIAPGYLPYTFSENLCNGKLAYAMYKKGWHVDVLSKVDEGPAYSTEWTEPWLPLKKNNITITYPIGGKLTRMWDVLRSSVKLGMYPEGGVRWACRAYELALKLCKENHYDAVLTRSPSDIPHIIGLRLKEKLGIRWIANWNDPAAPIWPEPYTHHFSAKEQARKDQFTQMCLKGADVNTFPSQSLLEHFTSHYPFLAEQKTEVIPHIALVEDIVPRLKVKPVNDKFRMCHSGNLSKERNPELTFKALRELIDEGFNKMEFSIMGHFNDYTTELIRKYQLEDYVKCIGGFPYMEAIQKMQEFDCLVLLEARLKKGIFFASKFTDYAQLGKPILAISPTNGFAADTLAQFGGGISVNNQSYRSIKNGILKLYMTWMNHTLSQDYSTQKLYEQVSAEHVIDIYERILED